MLELGMMLGNKQFKITKSFYLFILRCDQLRSFVCEVRAEDQYDETPHDWPACADQGMADKGFLAVRDSCYLPVEDTMTLQEAEAHCTRQGDSVHLLSVMDLVENDVAITLSNKHGNDRIWLGLQKSEVICNIH